MLFSDLLWQSIKLRSDGGGGEGEMINRRNEMENARFRLSAYLIVRENRPQSIEPVNGDIGLFLLNYELPFCRLGCWTRGGSFV